ncbi:MAG: metal ABC transporter substrate-binding protein [Dehalococcoidia bacterium]
MKGLRFLVLFALLAVLLVGACDDDDSGNSGDGATPTAEEGTPSAGGNLRIVTTVSPITSIAENIGGTMIDVEGIIPEGVNSHTYEPAPSVAALLSDADLIVVNGLDLEDPTVALAESSKQADTAILMLGNETITEGEYQYDFSFPEADGHPNPHLWPNPLYGLKYAELIRDKLVELDPDNADYYDANLEAFRTQIEDIDQRMMDAVQTVPEANRKLLTYHDSWAYWAPRYGFVVIGAVQPSDFSEPSAQEVADLIDQVQEEQVPAVFGSEVFPSDVLETIAEEGGAEFIDDLRDDDLPGAPGDANHTYVGLLLQNMEIMMPALGGNADAFEGYDPTVVFEGESSAVYPQ